MEEPIYTDACDYDVLARRYCKRGASVRCGGSARFDEARPGDLVGQGR